MRGKRGEESFWTGPGIQLSCGAAPLPSSPLFPRATATHDEEEVIPFHLISSPLPPTPPFPERKQGCQRSTFAEKKEGGKSGLASPSVEGEDGGSVVAAQKSLSSFPSFPVSLRPHFAPQGPTYLPHHHLTPPLPLPRLPFPTDWSRSQRKWIPDLPFPFLSSHSPSPN